MPRTRKDEAPILLDEPEIEGRYVELGEHTVSFESFHVDADPAPLFRGLPDDRCPCPHREETLEAGDAYVLTPGHLTLVTAGTEVVEFSPTAALQSTMAVVGANMAAAR
jgi:hypothetical protein